MTGKKSENFDFDERLSRQLDWNLLRTFIAIVQYGGISRAAEHIHLTQPAVSQALKRLETQLDHKLIERNARLFEVTEAGQLIYAKALDIQNQVSRLGQVVKAEKGKVFGHLRLLFASRLKTQVLDDILQKFHERHSAITIHIDVLPSAEIQALIHQGLASFGFCLLRGKPKGLNAELLIRQRYGLYCGKSHAYFGSTTVSMDDLRFQDFVSFPSDKFVGVLSPLTAFRAQHMYEGRVVATSINLEEIIRLTEVGIGIGLLPIHIAEERVATGQLWQLPPLKGIGPIDINLLWNPATEMSEAEKLFLEFSRTELKKRRGSTRAKLAVALSPLS
jgi:DNA-binding transcriptional LysR family regulator